MERCPTGARLSCAALICCVLAQGATVGVLDADVSSRGVVDSLEVEPGLLVKVLGQLSVETLHGVDVVIIAGNYDADTARETLREAVRNGTGVFFMHRTVMDGRTFPEIIREDAKGELDVAEIPAVLKPVRKHPITQGLPVDGFKRLHWKHAYTFPRDDRLVLMEDTREEDEFADRRFRGTQTRWAPYYGGHAVLVASLFGKGRVVFCGVCFGLNPGDRPVKVTGHERTLLVNAVRWLARETPLALPEPVQSGRSSRYRSHQSRRNPVYEPNGVRLVQAPDARVPADASGRRALRFRLPGSAPLGRVLPVRLVCPDLGFRPASIRVEDEAGVPGPPRPVQVLGAEGGTLVVLFTASFHSRRNRVTLSAEPCPEAPVVVRLRSDASMAEISTDTFRLIVASEGDRASIQSVQIRDWAWHHTWDGIERNTFTAPLLRIAETLRPFETRPYAVRHERGLPLPAVGADEHGAVFPVRAELLVGDGRLTVYHTGQLKIDGFGRRARFAAWLVDGYARSGELVPESASYDFPEVDSGWLWAVRNGRYAVGGTFRLTGRMGETGLAPGLEREAEFAGGALVLTTEVASLGRLQGVPEPVTVRARKTRGRGGRPSVPDRPRRLAPRTVTLRRLWRMRGTDEFLPVLPEPVEICADELERVPAVASWRIVGDDALRIASAPGRRASRALPDAGLREAGEVLDPFGEDTAYVWRRLFVACGRGGPSLRTVGVALEGMDEAGKCVLEIPVSVRGVVSVPMGIFTYSSQWIEQRELTPPDQWPKPMRDIALAELDYIIHVAVLGGEQENPPNVNNRLKRYGLWWLADIGRPGHAYLKNKRTPEARAELERQYAEVIGTFGSEPNVIGWMLSEELPSGKAENGVVPQGYADAKLFYDLSGKYDPGRPRVSLISVYFTPTRPRRHTSSRTCSPGIPTAAGHHRPSTPPGKSAGSGVRCATDRPGSRCAVAARSSGIAGTTGSISGDAPLRHTRAGSMASTTSCIRTG